MKYLLNILLTISLAVAAQSAAANETPVTAKHWAFEPVEPTPTPSVQCSTRARSAIDLFITATLEAKGLTLGPEASRETLIRRVALDLVGVPPTPAELDAYLNDAAPDAHARMVERFLASPAYGERWGKYWLDAAGYADSNGYRHSDSDRPLAYRYRDYVIRTFNADRPYDVFVREQLSGDEMAAYTPDGDVTPDMVDLLTATHFLRNAPDGSDGTDGNPDELRQDRYYVLEGVVQNTMNCFVGITIQCARCHDHKLEPVTQKEYYELQSIFFPAFCPEPFDRWRSPKDRIIEVATRARRLEYQRQNDAIDAEIGKARQRIETAAEPLRERLILERIADLIAEEAERRAVLEARETPERRLFAERAASLRIKESRLQAVLEARRTPEDRRSEEQKRLVEKHKKALEITDDQLAERLPIEFEEMRDREQQVIAKFEEQRPPPLEKLSVLVETDPQPPVHHILVRGSYSDHGSEVQPGVPAALTRDPGSFRVEADPSHVTTGRRTALARWLTSPRHPLLARVMVNRIWQHHFGEGIVSTPNNFGLSGARPGHPELLDYLALEFIRGDWSIKQMHRRILNSAVYRQSSAPRDGCFAVDPENHLLWRFPIRRLDAEAIRDSMLAVAGELSTHAFGPYVPVSQQGDGRVVVAANRDATRRRSIYLQHKRTRGLSMLEVFDAPAMVHNCARRYTSAVPLQSLTLLNSDFTLARARAFATRLLRVEDPVGPDPRDDDRLDRAYLLALGRPPTPGERAALKEFLSSQRQLHSGKSRREKTIWSELGQMMFASSPFLYIE
jgi:hypothetical protein